MGSWQVMLSKENTSEFTQKQRQGIEIKDNPDTYERKTKGTEIMGTHKS